MSFIFYAQSIDTATLTYSSVAETGYPLANMQDRNKNSTFYDNVAGAMNENLVIDLGSARACNYLILGNYLAVTMGTITLTIQCNSSNSWPGIEAKAATSILAMSMTNSLLTFNSQNYRYWRLVFTSSTDVLIGVSTLFLGTYYTLARTPELIPNNNSGYNVLLNESLGGNRFGYIANTTVREIWEYEFNYITDTEKTYMETWRDQIYISDGLSRYPFFYSPDSGTTLRYVRSNGLLNFEELTYGAYKVNIRLEQEL